MKAVPVWAPHVRSKNRNLRAFFLEDAEPGDFESEAEQREPFVSGRERE